MISKKKKQNNCRLLIVLAATFPYFSSVTEALEKGGRAKMAAGKNKLSSLSNLGNTETLSEEKQKKLALSAKQWGSILSSDDKAHTLADYVKSVGADLVSERINHWLNQYGSARFSLGTDKNIAGDLLLPVIDNADNLFFMQLGWRTNSDRNTTNLGVGYRQHWQNWMYGINTFYDYDYTGNNARLGLGLEALTDYLKLTTNGYFGLTDWHRSKLLSRHNYDERPATGFDIFGEAYLPTYPQLGARIKYEKYFGKGIGLTTPAAFAQLKDNPQSLMLGLSYTPIPLLTLTGGRTIGDRRDAKIGVEVVYHFGVPLLQQLDSHAVDKMRYLGSNKYNFVDRNYDIVMQYSERDSERVSPSAVDKKSFAGILASQFRFDVNSGFPKTGIKGAKMKLLLNGQYQAQDFEWQANQNWMAIDSSGEVTFIATPTKDNAIITATTKDGAVAFEYQFKIDKVYQASDSPNTWSKLEKYCREGYPRAADISTRERSVGKLWNEWEYNSIPNSNVKVNGIWVSFDKDMARPTAYPIIQLKEGYVSYRLNNAPVGYAVCLIK